MGLWNWKPKSLWDWKVDLSSGKQRKKMKKKNNCFWLIETIVLGLISQLSRQSWASGLTSETCVSVLRSHLSGLGSRIPGLTSEIGAGFGSRSPLLWSLANVQGFYLWEEYWVPGIGPHRKSMVLGPTFQKGHWN